MDQLSAPVDGAGPYVFEELEASEAERPTRSVSFDSLIDQPTTRLENRLHGHSGDTYRLPPSPWPARLATCASGICMPEKIAELRIPSCQVEQRSKGAWIVSTCCPRWPGRPTSPRTDHRDSKRGAGRGVVGCKARGAARPQAWPSPRRGSGGASQSSGRLLIVTRTVIRRGDCRWESGRSPGTDRGGPGERFGSARRGCRGP